MGKTQKPINILVTDANMLNWPELIKLRDQGCAVSYTRLEYGIPQFHAVIGPNCYQVDDTLRPFLKRTIAHIRERVYSKKLVTHGVEDTKIQPQASPESLDGDADGVGEVSGDAASGTP